MKADSMGFSLLDVLLVLGMQARTGELNVESGNNIGSVLFHNGAILRAFSPYAQAMGDLLVEQGMITDTELIETLMLQKASPGSLLGMLLLRKGKVAFEVIESMVHEQIRQAMIDFQSWKGITFNFEHKDIRPSDRIHLCVHEFIPATTMQSALSFLAEHTHEPFGSTQTGSQPIV
jgi:hypothetical protein